MENTKTTPGGYHSIVAYLSMKDAHKAIEFYKKVFSAKEIGRITTAGNKIGHAELEIGDSQFMIAEEMPEWGNKSPKTLGGSPVSICLYVEDVDAVFDSAIAAGATIKDGMKVKDQFYGDRSG
ncbi:MAG: VOC family protein, partial [Bacteroidia bacterium]